MFSFKLALFATTFACAVLAYPVEQRGFTGNVTADFITLADNLDDLKQAIGNVDSTGILGVPEILAKYRKLEENAVRTTANVNAHGPFEDEEAQQLIANQVHPVTDKLVDTVNLVVKQKDTLATYIPGVESAVQNTLQSLGNIGLNLGSALEDNMSRNLSDQQADLAKSLLTTLGNAIQAFSGKA